MTRAARPRTGTTLQPVSTDYRSVFGRSTKTDMATQNVALGVSVLALLVSGLAELIAWRSFRRAGARVAVDASAPPPIGRPTVCPAAVSTLAT